MQLIGNALNGVYFESVLRWGKTNDLEHIRLAVAYVTHLDPLFDMATDQGVPLTLYALADGVRFPSLPILQKFVDGSNPSWRLFLTRDFYHPKICWFVGAGAYIGSANLTQKAAYANLECGIWLSQEELSETNWEEELREIFEVIDGRSSSATQADLDAYRALQNSPATKRFRQADEALKAAIDSALGRIRGSDKPIDPNPKSGGGAARRRFVEKWDQNRTLLVKFAKMIKGYEWPSWASRDVHPVIAQDQATEFWYDRHVRRSGDSEATIEALHRQNQRHPDDAAAQMFEEWSRFDGEGRWQWPYWFNDAPRGMFDRLQPQALRKLDEEALTWILMNTHAAREHGRQIKKRELNLDDEETASKEVRANLFARLLFAKPSVGGRTVRDVLEFVVWGMDGEIPERIWDAAHTAKWKLPHLGENILGEIVGYARPDDVPPRNGRVPRSLRALGFDVKI